MYLTITGKLGSGKSTICGHLVKEYGFRRYSTGEVQRKIALDMGISTLELNELMRKEKQYDDLIDREVVKISKECQGENIIFDSRMAFHFVENAYDIFTTIDPAEAARRVMLSPRGEEETYLNEEDAKQQLLERGRVENVRFKDIYQVDNLDYANYNLIVDTTWAGPELLADRIYKAISEDLKAEKKQTLISPKSLYPTKALTELILGKADAVRKDGAAEKVRIFYFDNYHYIIDGHAAVLAAVTDQMDFVNAEIVTMQAEEIQKKLQDAGMHTLHQYEEIGGFAYKGYPIGYR